ncbi:hypothetical protein HRR83_002346 [Exophiala dermatitidis]|uniref:Uncharacterized protein n=1 Tax=Exophiala dermatitidis TaxID=5970 RepID=A0AAN6IZH5_EXODE|nr:hypothetical protein HRR74_002423 [Exophiala dermatitidis]KAJ4525501.1 hypothetical protein HRR73_002231 [Exophiala dermatitidis]KAJ4536818.1 hypothetical protein HRR76_004844 [Exophiala dermatitidis]KAJ4555580.1 hypothetical protein HRR77_001510 [Exophiala dermatitidis]KAJ4568884.1 hypothetical protein HRR81_006541 [Exophiala dermatitidis]
MQGSKTDRQTRRSKAGEARRDSVYRSARAPVSDEWKSITSHHITWASHRRTGQNSGIASHCTMQCLARKPNQTQLIKPFIYTSTDDRKQSSCHNLNDSVLINPAD